MKYNNFDGVIFYDAIEIIQKQLIAIAKAFSLLWQDIDRTIDLLKSK